MDFRWLKSPLKQDDFTDFFFHGNVRVWGMEVTYTHTPEGGPYSIPIPQIFHGCFFGGVWSEPGPPWFTLETHHQYLWNKMNKWVISWLGRFMGKVEYYLYGNLTETASTVKQQTRRRMARERRGAGSSLVSMETQY